MDKCLQLYFLDAKRVYLDNSFLLYTFPGQKHSSISPSN